MAGEFLPLPQYCRGALLQAGWKHWPTRCVYLLSGDVNKFSDHVSVPQGRPGREPLRPLPPSLCALRGAEQQAGLLYGLWVCKQCCHAPPYAPMQRSSACFVGPSWPGGAGGTLPSCQATACLAPGGLLGLLACLPAQKNLSGMGCVNPTACCVCKGVMHCSVTAPLL